MLHKIPVELQPYVRMSKKEGLIHSDKMPEELQELFVLTKKSLEESMDLHRTELKSLLPTK